MKLKMVLLTLISLVVVLQGCELANKNLTSASARSMLEERFSSEGDTYLIDVAPLAQLIRARTRENYSTGSYAQVDPRGQVQRLLREGYITESHDDLKYRNVTGTYKYDFPPLKEIYTFVLSMQPDSPAVSGQYTFGDWSGSSPPGSVSGEVDQSGTVTLTYERPWDFKTDISSFRFHATYTITGEGSTIRLTRPKFSDGASPPGIPLGYFGDEGPVGPMTLTGNGPGGLVTVPWYSYAFSDKMRSMLDPSGIRMKAGKIEIDEVRNLLLAGETAATGEFTWHATLNDAGKAITGIDTMHGAGSASFGKQPDGTWVLIGHEMR